MGIEHARLQLSAILNVNISCFYVEFKSLNEANVSKLIKDSVTKSCDIDFITTLILKQCSDIPFQLSE